jgi:CubicO group peptidase (beta-lactamase class C family)
MSELAALGADVQSRLDEVARASGVPGAVLGLLTPEGTEVFATGLLNVGTGVEATPDSLFQVGSITKVYTATMILQLVDEGRVTLDDAVARHVPGLRLGAAEATEAVTIRQLLDHTSGIDGDQFADFGRGDDCLERFVAAMSTLPQLAAPGALFSYSNAAYVLAGRLVELLDGVVYDKALARRIFEPLGMRSSTLLADDAILHRVAAGHVGHGRSVTVATRWALPRSLGPCGLICQSMGDLLRFARLHLESGRIEGGTEVLSTAAATAMCAPSVELPPYSGAASWGLGWAIYDWAEQPVVGHDGGTIGQGAYLRLLPERGLAVALVANADDRTRLVRDLLHWLWQELTGDPVPGPPVPPPEAPTGNLDVYQGTFERLGGEAEVTASKGGLDVALRATGPLAGDQPDPPPLRLLPFDATTFVSPGACHDRVAVAFTERDTAGRPNVLHLRSRAFRRTTAALGS